MADCNVIRERMPLLLTGALEHAERESTLLHIEQCTACGPEWEKTRETWRLMGELPEVPLPARLRESILQQLTEVAPVSQVLPFRARKASRWLAQAAAVTILVGGSWFAGRTTAPLRPGTTTTPATVASITPASFSLAENRVLSTSQVNPEIQGQPNIQNVKFFESTTRPDEVGVTFDITSHMTVTGKPNDRSLVRILTYMLQNNDHPTPSRSDTMQWVKETYSGQGGADPEIVRALTNVLKNDTHEGVRIKAVETLKSLPASLLPDARTALIEALKTDPNPAVRIKAVEALANLASSGTALDTATLDTLRQKASQSDENLYVRVKAAEALSQVNF